MLRIGELSDAGRFVFDQFETYLDLAQAEFSEQRRQTVRRAVWAAVAAFACLLGVGFLGLAILIASWDTEYRMTVAMAIPAVLLVLALLGFLIARRSSAAQGWARIGSELRQDIGTLRDILWKG